MMSHQGGDSTSGGADGGTRTAAGQGTTETENPDTQPGSSGSSNGSLRTRIAIVLLGIVLLATVAGANVSVAADRTVLDADYVVETIEEEGLFAEETDNFRSEVANEISAGTDELSLPPGLELTGFDPEATAQESVSESYVREQMAGNIERLYAFLHGDRDDIAFVVELGPVKDGIADSVAESATVDTPVLVGESSDRIDRDRVAALEEDEESFEDAQMDRSDEQVESVKSDIEADVQAADYSPELTEALTDLQFTVVDGLAGELTYAEYTEQLESDERAVEAALGTEAVAGIDETMTLGEDSEDPSESFSQVADVVQLVSTLALALPVLAVVLLGVLGVVTRSVRRTAFTGGLAVLTAGIIGLVVAYAVPGFALPDRSGEEPDLFADGFLAAIEGLFEALNTQSVLLTLGGLLLFGLAIADSRGLFDRLKESVGSDTEQPAQGSPDQPETTTEHDSDRQVGGE